MSGRENYINVMAETELRTAINAITKARCILPDDFAQHAELQALWTAALAVEQHIRDERER